MSVNSVYLMGRCGKTPDVRTAGQSKVASFSLCTGGKYKTKDGREVDDTAWHNIVAWRHLADLAEKYIDKGSQVLVIGHISYREYAGADGNKRNITEIVAEKIELCGGKSDGQKTPTAPQQRFDPQTVHTTPIEAGEPQDDDLPF